MHKNALAMHVDEYDSLKQGPTTKAPSRIAMVLLVRWPYETYGHNHGVTIRDAIGRQQNVTTINESGLYSLILSSRLVRLPSFQ